MQISLTMHPTLDEKFYDTKGPKSYDYQHIKKKWTIDVKILMSFHKILQKDLLQPVSK